jgi:hypothetical protein
MSAWLTGDNFTDPCLRAQELRRAFLALISGQHAYEVTYLSNGVTRTLRFSQADLSRLEIEMRAAEQECAGTTGRRVSTVRLVTSKGV